MSGNGFPFTSRAQVIARIAVEPAFAVECVTIIEDRKAWMASHRARAAKLIARLRTGEHTPADCDEAAVLAARYGKTLARVFRERELSARPELLGQAVVYGVVRAPTQPATTPGGAPAAVLEGAPVISAPKRRGRPKGSKNKVRAESEPRRRKRA